MIRKSDQGMATAEYSVGTVGAVLIAVVLYKLGLLGVEGPWLGPVWETVKQALTWRNIVGDLSWW